MRKCQSQHVKNIMQNETCQAFALTAGVLIGLAGAAYVVHLILRVAGVA